MLVGWFEKTSPCIQTTCGRYVRDYAAKGMEQVVMEDPLNGQLVAEEV